MAKSHDRLKLSRRPSGIELFFTKSEAPFVRIVRVGIQAGMSLMLRSAEDAAVGICAKVLFYDGHLLMAEILGFERWGEETHNGMARGDIIWCDESYVIACQCD